MSRGTLTVGEIINLTEEEIFCYDSAGELVSLKPSTLPFGPGRSLPPPKPSTYYVAKGELAIELTKNRQYAKLILHPQRQGTNRDGVELTRLINEHDDIVQVRGKGHATGATRPRIDPSHIIGRVPFDENA